MRNLANEAFRLGSLAKVAFSRFGRAASSTCDQAKVASNRPDPWGSPIKWRQYLESPSTLSVANPSWQLFVNSKGIQIQSMLSLAEAAICYALARDFWTGRGEILDLGCPMGLSTHCFALGVQDNEMVPAAEKSHRIASYDLFLSSHLPPEFHSSRQADSCGSLFDHFLSFNRDYLDFISINPGDILSLKWADRPTEIVFVDIAKSLELNAWVVRNVFSQLLPGAIVVQQDFAYEQQWWIAATMEYMRPFFKTLDYCWGATAVFQLSPDLEATELDDFRLMCANWPVSLGFAGWNEMLLLAAKNHHVSTNKILQLARACMLIQYGRIDESKQIIQSTSIDGPYHDAYRDFDNIVPYACERLFKQIDSGSLLRLHA